MFKVTQNGKFSFLRMPCGGTTSSTTTKNYGDVHTGLRVLTWGAKDRVEKPCSGSPIYSSGVRGVGGAGRRPALAAAASPDSLTPPRVQAVLVLALLAAVAGGSRGRAPVGGAPANQAGRRSGGGVGRGRRGCLDRLLQGGALP